MDLFIDVLHWFCNGILNNQAELTLGLRKKPNPVLALSEGAQLDMETLRGYVEYLASTSPIFLFGSAGLSLRLAFLSAVLAHVLEFNWNFERNRKSPKHTLAIFIDIESVFYVSV